MPIKNTNPTIKLRARYNERLYVIDYKHSGQHWKRAYQAGNNSMESQGYLPADHPQAEPLNKMKEYANITLKDFGIQEILPGRMGAKIERGKVVYDPKLRQTRDAW